MWDLGIGVIIGIYLGTYYNFRPILESIMKWGVDRLPPERTATARKAERSLEAATPAKQSIFASFLTPDKK